VSDAAELEGYLSVWKTGFASRQWVCQQLNKNPAMRQQFLKALKLNTAAEMMEALVKP
jgi:hypothetical protein